MIKYANILILALLLLPSNKVFASYFEDSLKSLILEKIGLHYSIDLKFESNGKLDQIISRDHEISSVALSFYSPQTKSFKALVKFTQENIEIFGKFDTYFEIYLSNKFIKHGKQINPEDIKLVKVKKIQDLDDIIKNPSMLYGMETRQNILPGKVIRLIDLKKSPLIKENDPVTLLYESNAMSLKTLGIAMAQGGIGDKIRAKNEKTGIVVFGEVVDKNIIRVSDPND